MKYSELKNDVKVCTPQDHIGIIICDILRHYYLFLDGVLYRYSYSESGFLCHNNSPAFPVIKLEDLRSVIQSKSKPV